MLKLVERKQAASADFETASAPRNKELYICRLCLKDAADITNLFEEDTNDADMEMDKNPLAQRLYELFQIQYEKSNILPKVVCRHCLDMVEKFFGFKANMQKCEAILQQLLLNLKKTQCTVNCDDNRPGLNGNDGVFLPEEFCEITEVDPDQEYESSDDDFSMESDTDGEDATTPLSTSLTAPNLIKPAETRIAMVAHNEIPNEGQMPMKINGKDSALVVDTDSTKSDLLLYSNSFANAVPIFDTAMEYIKQTYLCQFCDMAFVTQADCTEHEGNHNNAAPYLCRLCSLQNVTRQNLITHVKETHDAERPYICMLCSKGFCRRSDLKKHTIVHTGVRPFTCSICGKCFSRNTNLTKHMRIHSSQKPHVCLYCPRSFQSASELLRHGRTHTETKPFQCSRCPLSFARKEKLQVHEQGHHRRESEYIMNQVKSSALASTSSADNTPNTQIENMSMPMDPYANLYTTSPQFGAVPSPIVSPANPPDDAYRHSILATQLQQRTAHPKPVMSKNTRIFACSICGRQFTRERDLQRHSALHLDSLFTCKECGIGFSRREKLARHEQEAHGPQYPCEICRISFTNLHELQQHEKMHELQQNVALTTQAALNAATTINSMQMPNMLNTSVPQQQQTQAANLQPEIATRPSAEDMSFYNQMVPTMNLGFYSETRPEDRNGI